MYFDSHIHTDGLGFSELKKLNDAGVTKVCSPSFYPVRPNYPQTMIDVFRKLTEFEVDRCKLAGIEMYPAVGIHPRCIPPNFELVLEYLESHDWIAFGEIGLEDLTETEMDVLERQLRIAMEKDIPCLIHTPRKNKRKATKATLRILEKINFPEDLAVIDHTNFDNLDLVIKSGYWIGLTVQPGKLSVNEVVRIVREKGVERFMLNSDAGYKDMQFTSVPDAARELEKAIGIEGRKIYYENASKFFRV